jgi:outer membrane protein OmpA-like peptidoglycan-associated protein
MEKKQLTKEQIREQMQKLSGISDEKNRLNESKAVTSTNSSTLLSCKRAADGKTYAVIKENHNYFVKVSTLVKDINKYNVYDFAYIGGLSRKMIDECYSSYADATNRLHTKLMVLKEAWTGKADVQEDEIPLNKDVDAKEDPNKEKEGEEVAVDTDTEVAPAEETPATPTEEPSVEPAPAPEKEAPVDAEPSLEDVPADSEETPTEQPATDEPKDDSDADNIEKEIQSLLGKLSAAYQQKGEVTPTEAKSAINTIISSTKSGIEQMDEPDKDDLKKRIEKNGEKLDETEELSDEELNEAISFLKKLNEDTKVSKMLNKIIKEELDNFKQEKELELALESLTEEELEQAINEYDVIDEDEDSCDYNAIEEKLKHIQEESEKMALEYVNKKTEGKTLNEASLADLTKKAKALFNKKSVESLVNSDPNLKKQVDTVKKAVDSYNAGDPSMFEKLKSTGKKGLTTILIILSLLGQAVPAIADANPTAVEDLKDKVELVDTNQDGVNVAKFNQEQSDKSIDFNSFFTSDSDSIAPEKEQEIVNAYNKFAEQYNINPKDSLTISVGTDQQRSRAFESNEALAQARANALTKVLRKNGVVNPIKVDLSGVNGGSAWDQAKFVNMLKTDKEGAAQYLKQWRAENQPARFVKVTVTGQKAGETVKLVPTTYNLDINLAKQNSDQFRNTVNQLKELGGSDFNFKSTGNYVVGKTAGGSVEKARLEQIINLLESNKDLFTNSGKVIGQLKSLLNTGGQVQRTADTGGNVM